MFTDSSKGVLVSSDWLTQCLAYLSGCSVITRTTNLQTVVDAVFRVFLESDLYTAMDEVDLIPDDVKVVDLPLSTFRRID